MNAIQKKRLRNKEYQRERRRDPAYRERQRLYFQTRRQDPAYREKQQAYSREYRKRPEVKIRQKIYDKKYRKTNALARKTLNEKILEDLFSCVLILE